MRAGHRVLPEIDQRQMPTVHDKYLHVDIATRKKIKWLLIVKSGRGWGCEGQQILAFHNVLW